MAPQEINFLRFLLGFCTNFQLLEKRQWLTLPEQNPWLRYWLLQMQTLLFENDDLILIFYLCERSGHQIAKIIAVCRVKGSGRLQGEIVEKVGGAFVLSPGSLQWARLQTQIHPTAVLHVVTTPTSCTCSSLKSRWKQKRRYFCDNMEVKLEDGFETCLVFGDETTLLTNSKVNKHNVNIWQCVAEPLCGRIIEIFSKRIFSKVEVTELPSH